MKILLLALSFQTVSAPDRWFSADKVQHFFIGTFVQSASFGVLRAAKVDMQPALIAASAVSAAAAIGKDLTTGAAEALRAPKTSPGRSREQPLCPQFCSELNNTADSDGSSA
jgi:hypothetical protein